jgi:hypothetical protein
MEGRSLAVDEPWASRAFPGGEARRDASKRQVAGGEAALSRGGDPQD